MPEEQPLVSVVMPAYNAVGFIDEAVASVIKQDYRPIELIIADDASGDGTAERVKTLAIQHSDVIKPLLNRQNIGITRNFNQAFRAASGKYLALAAGDDLLLPGKLSAQVRWLEESTTRVLCGHDVEIFQSETGRSLGLYSAQHPLLAGAGPTRLIRNGVLYAGSAVMFRRSALPEHLHDERLNFVSDWQIQVDTLAGGGEFGFVEGVLSRYRRHGGSATAYEALDASRIGSFLDDRMVAATVLQLRHPRFTADLRMARSRFLLTAAQHLLTVGSVADIRMYLAWAIREDPRMLAPAAATAALSLLPRPARRLAVGAARRHGIPNAFR